jgi:hypothetical protein
MKKTINIILKVILSIILLMPVLGTLGVFPPPTPEMYNNREAYDFIVALMDGGKYIMWLMTAVFLICFVLTLKNKMAVVALILLPITLNIMGFHAFLDGGLLKSGAMMGNVFFLINLYYLWQNKDKYKALF